MDCICIVPSLVCALVCDGDGAIVKAPSSTQHTEKKQRGKGAQQIFVVPLFEWIDFLVTRMGQI